MSGDRTPKVFLSSKHSELNGTFCLTAGGSPTNRMHRAVTKFVRPFPDKEPAQTVSHEGGMFPRWRGDGKELFFVSPDGTMMAAGFDPTNGLPEGVPQPLFPTRSDR